MDAIEIGTRAHQAIAAWRGHSKQLTQMVVWSGDFLDNHIAETLRNKRQLLARLDVGYPAWPNWHINRGRMPHNPSKQDLRRTSWRRAH